ncbi:MAG: thiamine pyrophosphate-dependent enzyme [Candidatus Liptonbacteria bacterium]|nr:thiamine pyrophosphate-dependent enzyme [Candidatus Liptonbacteria bacterium]
MNLSTSAKITWCPGCPDSQILVAFRQAITELVKGGKLKIENLVALAGIGCHGKIADYLNVNTFNSLHGRLVPTMTGVKTANGKLTVVGFSGDGDSYDEGLDHLIHAARRNSDISLFIHNNQVFALTTGQATPTTPKGFKGKSTPFGSFEEPFDPLLLMLSAGATFVARSYAGDIQGTKRVMLAAMAHKGFSFVDIIQPCITFFDTREYYQAHVYWIDESSPRDNFAEAIAKITEKNGKTPLGIFYRAERPTFEEGLRA